MTGAYRDGEPQLRARLDQRRQRRGELLAQRALLDGELADVEGEIRVIVDVLEPIEPTPRRSGWGGLVVAGGCLATTGLAVAAAIAFAYPTYTLPKIDAARTGASAVRQAAELYANLDATTDACPTLDDLVAAKKLDRAKTDDPWGRAYRIECVGDTLRVWSAGRDGEHRTADDVADDFGPGDMKRIAALD